MARSRTALLLAANAVLILRSGWLVRSQGLLLLGGSVAITALLIALADRRRDKMPPDSPTGMHMRIASIGFAATCCGVGGVWMHVFWYE